MKKILILILNCLTFILNAQTVMDIDGNKYKTVRIGNQIWMQENLRVTKFNDGTPITKEKIAPNDIKAIPMNWDTLEPMYSVYPSFDPKYTEKNGLIYNGVIIDNKNVCPIGWHIPTIEEFETLSKFSGGFNSWKLTINDTTSLFKIKKHGHHRHNYNASYSNDFTTFIPNGTIGGYPDGINRTNLWTSTKVIWVDKYGKKIYGQYSFQFNWNEPINEPTISLRDYGYYIRCIMD